jgi:pyruvate/2-oxoglutarate dehydrogenase complex dihydrolipoamide dehydrogenase (E3) component/uncharacterized membrane protein YdjX (TVP38/TMEM64 family)
MEESDFVRESSTYHAETGSAKLILLVIIAAAALASLFLLPVKSYMVYALEWTKGLGAWGPLFVIVFYVLACLLFLPGSLLTLGAGFLFGLTVGFPTAWIGANLGAAAAFLVGRTVGRDWVARKVEGNPRFKAIDQSVGREGFKIVFLLRLSPVFPFNLLNYSLGLTNVPFGTYVIASMIGMIPAGFMYCYFGSAARSLADVAAGQTQRGPAEQVFFWLGLAATVAVAVVVTRIAARSLTVSEGSAQTAAPEANMRSPWNQDRLEDVLPDDEHNKLLKANTHPPQWVNPDPLPRYNLVVIGAGTAGLVTAAGAAGLGAKVALVERHLMGGDCLNVGCVPSKALIRSSRTVAELRGAGRYGIAVPTEAQVDFPAVMERMRRLRARISHHDSAERFRSLGVDVFFGQARFTGPDAVEVGGKTLRFTKACICTGGRAVQPAVQGLAEAGFLTNETIFTLTERPARLAVIGAGPIGCEMAQTFRRLGSHVVLFHKNRHILDREDSDAADILQTRFVQEEIMLILGANPREVQMRGAEKIILFDKDGERDSVVVDEILVAAGRAPNVEGLDLETAGVEYDTRAGVHVNDRLQTTNPRIFAAGDICMKYKFTHAADAAARVVIQNALFKGSKKLSALTVPWCTYTDPEIAHVGMYERDAEARGIAVDTYERQLTDVDRAVVDGEDQGFVKVHVRKGKDTILGATVVAAHAGEMIGEITLAMEAKMGLAALSRVIHPYPTQAEAIRQVADAYNRTRLTPMVKKLFRKWLDWTR